MQIPHFNTEVVSTDHISARIAELDIAYTRDDLGEEAPVSGVFRLLEQFAMSVAKCCRSHVAQSDRAFTTAVDKQVALNRMELGCCYDLGQFLHVSRFNVYNVCARC